MKDRIKSIRHTLGLTQQKFADRLGVKGNTISQYESGRNAPVDSVISLICREFNVNEDWLRTGKGDMFAPESAIDLGEYAKRHGMTRLETEILKAYLELAPDVRESLLQHFKERLTQHPTQKRTEPDTSGQERTAPTYEAEDLERQADEFAALAREQYLREKKKELQAQSASGSDAG